MKKCVFVCHHIALLQPTKQHNTLNKNANTHRIPEKYCLVRSLIKMKEKQLNSVHHQTISISEKFMVENENEKPITLSERVFAKKSEGIRRKEEKIGWL